MFYPYVVIRYMAAVYHCEGVALNDVDVNPGLKRFYEIELCPGYREALCNQVLAKVRRDGFRRCVVFGEANSVYIEADGSMKESDAAPSGGVELKGKMTIGSKVT
ncbi:MAG: hypothetical protein H7222_04280 [Methylotenera sp.]|nr:hypothetical protein [Oligoflexia bacterium]